MSKFKRLQPLFILILSVIIIAPISTYAQAIGEPQIDSFFKQIMDTLKLIAPYAATAYIGFSGVQVLFDMDNGNKKNRLITSVVISAIALFFVFGAESIVAQLRGIAEGS